MALLQKFLLNGISYNSVLKTKKNNIYRERKTCCSAIVIDSPSSLTGVSGIRWGSSRLQGPREEMEDDIVLRSDDLNGFSFAAVFDGHAGFSSVEFLRDELYKECVKALQGGLLLCAKDLNPAKQALQEAFVNADTKLLKWLDAKGEDEESGATATVVFVGNDMLIISHIGDSCVVLSRAGKTEIVTNPHRPYGSNKVSLQEIRRIREAGGWITDGRICGDISVSRAFGDTRFKTKKNEMLEKGVEEGRWTKKFISRVQFKDDLVIASPDIYNVNLGSDAEFLLLASDGLWDYMKSSDAVNFVRNQLREHGNVQLACEALAQLALDRRSQDNVSIVIADFGKTDWSSLPAEQQNVVLEFSQAFATLAMVSLGIWMTSLLSS
ncbi:protein phosphatase 2C 57-like [Papaver somniferum]|uniref:protein phosphatase 2C 57-like n=1 Tax=Papaver somniferum TaxID=3469 RepID=UPI000E6F80BB|nr:protein phosphatase 2C 57-like [Papaver somniferum]XP_026425623.1 protein phosphatase 2C 57-like [Papaver somniferum]